MSITSAYQNILEGKKDQDPNKDKKEKMHQDQGTAGKKVIADNGGETGTKAPDIVDDDKTTSGDIQHTSKSPAKAKRHADSDIGDKKAFKVNESEILTFLQTLSESNNPFGLDEETYTVSTPSDGKVTVSARTEKEAEMKFLKNKGIGKAFWAEYRAKNKMSITKGNK